MNQISPMRLAEVVAHFQYEGRWISGELCGNGHINDTYLLVFERGEGEDVQFILQRINTNVFHDPVQLMENIVGVTGYLRKKILENGGNPDRETLNLVPTVSGEPYYCDSCGDYWRSYHFITDAVCYDQVEKPEHFYQSAVAFGNFQRLLADYPAETLHETIPGFHDTKARFAALKRAIEEDVMGRAVSVQKEIGFALEREAVACYFSERRQEGELPLRVTHNDTKLNNIMFDEKTGRAICVIDLDTVMPGLSVYDFGDSVRFGASTAAEDERDLTKVSCSMELFDLYTKGFLEGCAGRLTDRELEELPMGAKVMTFECGMRFLTDYLQGDTYFKIHREGHNLDRCRTQFKLVADMESKWEMMQGIVRKYRTAHTDVEKAALSGF